MKTKDIKNDEIIKDDFDLLSYKKISKFIYILCFLLSSIKYSDILAALESDASSTTIGI